MSARTRSDLPDPEGPRIRTPASPSATVLACSVSLRETGSGIAGFPILREYWNADDESRPQDRTLATRRRLAITVFRPDAALMRLDDLARDRQAEAGVLAEGSFRTVGIETLKDALEIFGRNARPLVF